MHWRRNVIYHSVLCKMMLILMAHPVELKYVDIGREGLLFLIDNNFPSWTWASQHVELQCYQGLAIDASGMLAQLMLRVDSIAWWYAHIFKSVAGGVHYREEHFGSTCILPVGRRVWNVATDYKNAIVNYRSMVLWKALRTLNPATRVKTSVEPSSSHSERSYGALVF